MNWTLAPGAATSLGQASPAAVQAAAAKLRVNIPTGEWLVGRNLYWPKPDVRFRKSARVWRNELAAYMAASVPEHCVDGWSYLGRALQSHMRGDLDSARHLAYYAELRAGIALLASQGIGVFNGVNVVLDGSGKLIKLPSAPALNPAGKKRRAGTHQAVWLFLEEWSPRSAGLLERIITPEGYDLAEWLERARLRLTWSSIGPKLLKSWGLDLQRLSEDREARNEASYLPTRIRKRPQLAPGPIGNFVVEMWNALRPATHSPFDSLDRDLLRHTLRLAISSTRSRAARNDALQRSVNAAVAEVLPPSDTSGEPPSPHAQLREFLLADDSEQPSPILSRAAELLPAADPDHHLAVIARAVLLLRVATGATRRLLFDAGIASDNLEPWIVELGIDRGLWAEYPEDADITILWSDIREALEDVLDEASKPPATVFDLLDSCSNPLSRLGGCELVPIWALTP